MKVHFNPKQRKELRNKLKLLEQIIKLDLKLLKTKNTKIPFFISAKKRGLFLEYSGGHCVVSLSAEAEVVEAGQTATAFNEMEALIKGIGSNDKELTLHDSGSLYLVDPNQQLNFPLSESQFDLQLQPQGNPIPGLSQAIKRVRYAISNEEYRAVLTGVQLEFSERGLKTVSSDGFRIAMYDTPCQSQPTTLVLPKHAAEMLCALFEKDLEVRVNPTPKHLEVYSPTTSASFKIMDSTFPDYARVIPETYNQKATINAEEVVQACSNIVTSKTEHYRVNLSLNEPITIYSEKDGKVSKHTLNGNYKGPPCEVSFNANYLKEAFFGLQGPTDIYLKDTQPAFIEQEGYSAVVVPLRE